MRAGLAARPSALGIAPEKDVLPAVRDQPPAFTWSAISRLRARTSAVVIHSATSSTRAARFESIGPNSEVHLYAVAGRLQRPEVCGDCL